MTTDFLSTPSTVTVASLLVAGLGAVYAYTQHTHTRAHAYTTRPTADGELYASTSGATRKGKKKKGKSVDVDEGVGVGVGVDEGKGGATVAVPSPRVVPGDFEGVGAEVDAGTDVGSREAPVAQTLSKQGSSKKTKTTKKKQKKQKKKQGGVNDRDEHEEEVGEETGKKVGVDDVGRIAACGPRSGDSTDASASLSPSVSASVLQVSSRAMGKGNLRASTRLASPREIRPSLSLDTDSSWTHVDRHRLKTSGSIDGQTRGPADAMDTTSSEVASTTSDSPVMKYMDNVTTDMRGARADLVQRTLAERLVPRPKEMGVDDMLEQPDFPTLARVMRVQPPADETPVPGFSWDDYGDVVEESLLVDDADQEGEGEWGIIKSRHHTRSSQTTTTITAASHALAAPERMTKRQRQNARKRELAKSARAEAEAMRVEGLAKHKRELERLRIIEQSQRGGGKRPSGGMQAMVDDRGKLVWE